MYITSPTFKQFYYSQSIVSSSINNYPQPDFNNMVEKFCESFKLPDEKYNYSRFDEELAEKISSYKDGATKPVVKLLSQTEDETRVTAGLYLLNRIIDAGAKNAGDYYHVISKFNNSDSANVQTMLAGVYRKTQIPDGFASLMTMYLKNLKNQKTKPFNPDEEICGAILAYLGNKEITDALLDYLKKNNSMNAMSNYSCR